MKDKIKTLVFKAPLYTTKTDVRICSSSLWLFHYPAPSDPSSITMQISKFAFSGARRIVVSRGNDIFSYEWLCPKWAGHPFVEDRGYKKLLWMSFGEYLFKEFGKENIDTMPLYFKMDYSK